MSATHDHAHRHPDALFPDTGDLPHPDTFDPLYEDKLIRALDYLGARARIRPDCVHRYVNSEGDKTNPEKNA